MEDLPFWEEFYEFAPTESVDPEGYSEDWGPWYRFFIAGVRAAQRKETNAKDKTN